jgi:WD40 repeat protein
LISLAARYLRAGMRKHKVYLAAVVLLLSLSPGPGSAVTASVSASSGTSDSPTLAPTLVAQIGHISGVYSVAYSPDGAKVLTGGGDNMARLWDAATGSLLRTFEGHTAGVYSVAYSPEGTKVLTGSADTTARLWDAVTGALLRSFEGHTATVWAVAFSPDGTKVLTGGFEGTARLWDTATGALIRPFEGHTLGVASVAFSPDGTKVLTGSFDKTARAWDAATGAQLRSFEGHTGEVMSVTFSPDGTKVLTGSWDHSAREWGAASGVLLRSFGHAEALNSVAYSTDGTKVLTGGGDNTARLWDAATGALVRPFVGHTSLVFAKFSPDGTKVLTGSWDNTAREWDAASGALLRSFEGHTNTVHSVAFSPDGTKVLTGSEDTTARLWDATSGALVRSFEGHAVGVVSVAFSPDGTRVLTGSRDNTARAWNATTGVQLRSFEGHTGWVRSVAFSPDGTKVLTGSTDTTAKLWDAATGALLRSFEGHNHWVQSVAFSPDGTKVLTGSADTTAREWDVATGSLLGTFGDWGRSDLYKVQAGGVGSVAYSLDGTRVLTGNGNATATLWDAATGAELRSFEGHFGDGSSVAFSPDGTRVLIVSGAKSVRLWDAATGALVRSFIGHSADVESVAFSPDGTKVLTGSGDSTTRVWSVETGRELCSLVYFDDGTWVVTNPDGRFDADNLEDVKGLHWIVADDPFTPLPIDVFMRDYYEPGLLRRIWEGGELPDAPNISTRIRTQPEVAIDRVALHPDDARLVDVTVTVAGAARAYGDREVATGAVDLRLFRDGRRVGCVDGRLADAPAPAAAGAPLRPVDPHSRNDRIGAPRSFTLSVRLPAGTTPEDLDLTAYCFNDSGVKSPTAHRASVRPDVAATATKGIAYVVAFGSDAFDDPKWTLSYGSADATGIRDALANGMAETGAYARVEAVALTASPESKPEERTATKAALLALLELLAGREPDPAGVAVLRRDPAVARLLDERRIRAAAPEDTLILHFSTHGALGDGDVGKRGAYYLAPSDIGTAGDLGRWISTDELSERLTGVDASGVIVLDACHSGGATGEGFKPGPMNARGLGQLAFDKKYRVLAGSQAAQTAGEYAVLGHGLVTWALLKTGLAEFKADANGDATLAIAEWLRHAESEVPKLNEALAAGKLGEYVKASRGVELLEKEASQMRRKRYFQRPSVFDFARGRWDLPIARRR